MNGVSIALETTGFRDTAKALERNVNAITGLTLATWLCTELKSQGYETSDVWDEDHGWDFEAVIDGQTYLCACQINYDYDDLDDEPTKPSSDGAVVVEKHRGFMDRLRRHNAMQRDDSVLAIIETALRERQDVSRVELVTH